MNVQQVLSDLIFFVLDEDEDIDGNDEVKPLLIDGIPPPNKQRLVKDMKVLEILTDILYYSFENKLCSFEDDG